MALAELTADKSFSRFLHWRAFPSKRLLASATLDRLRHNACCRVRDGQSYRSPRVKPTATRARKFAATTEEGHS